MLAQPKAIHFVNRTYMEDAAGTALEATYPATGEVIARLREATPVLVDKAVRHARVAQKEWAAWSGTERG